MTSNADPRPTGVRYWLVLALIGGIGGVLSGAFGVGGGILMVPLLVGLAGMDQRRASAASLAAIIPTAIAGAATYGINGEVDLRAALFLAIGAVVGAWAGARLLRLVPIVWLRWMFISLLLLVAIRMALVAPERGAEVEFAWYIALALVAAGLVMGLSSGLFGVGGGVVLVPILIALFGAGDLVAKGTSLLVMIPSALTGTITNVRGGLVDMRIGAVVGLAATLTSFIGVALAFLIPPHLSGILFAALLVVSAAQLIIKALRASRTQKRGPAAA